MKKLPECNKQNESWNWKEYYELLEGIGHTKSLEVAVTEYCKDKSEALDIGAGNLRDTKYLLKEGFTVTAVDPSPVSVKFAEQLNNSNFIMVPEIIGKYSFPENHFSLVNAQGMLFHFPEPRFSYILNNIKKTLKSRGILCADFIGEKDEWNYQGTTKTIVSKKILQELFNNFDIKYFNEFERDETLETAHKKGKDTPKHWHHINIIAVKK